MLPDESAGEVEVELRSLVAGLSARDPDFRATVRGLGSRPAYEIARDALVVELVSNAIRKILGSDAAEQFAGMAAWTDTALLAEAGIPGVVFGPSGRGLHGKEEYVELDSVSQCGEILLESIRAACNQ